MRGGVSEGRELCRDALALDGGHRRGRACAASNGAGILAAEQGDFDAARVLLRGRARARPRARRPRTRGARSSPTSASSPSTRGDFETAIALYADATDDRARARRRARRQPLHAEPRDRARRGRATSPEAIALLEESVEIARARRRAGAPDLDRGVARARAARRRRGARDRAAAPGARASARDRRLLRARRLPGDRRRAASRRGDPRAGAQLWGAADAAAGGARARRASPTSSASASAWRPSCARRSARTGSRPRWPRARALGARGGRQPGRCESKAGTVPLRFAPASGVERGRAARRRRPPTPRAGSRPRGRRSPGRRTRRRARRRRSPRGRSPRQSSESTSPNARPCTCSGIARCSRIRLLVLNRPFAAPVKPNVNSANPSPGANAVLTMPTATPPRPAK